MKNNKIPVIQATIGNWTYYTGVMSFYDIAECVSPINNALHKSQSLSDAIQRSITGNYLAIKEYILNQDERFFNAIVLAIYDGNPNWIEVELEIEGDTFYNLGFLSFSGDEKLFPVDGQHRVAGIKEALVNNESLKNEKVPVIFIGHKTSNEGMQRTRRLFSTLNRYAKPVSKKDIVALDEDDIVAITTRYLVESHVLFEKERVVFSLQKGISSSNKKAFTSLITLSDCVDELFKYYFSFFKNSANFESYRKMYFPEKRSIGVKDFKRFRPSDEVIDDFISFNTRYWNKLIKLNDIDEYIKDNSEEPSSLYRNKENGGNVLFRPIGLVPFVQATISDAKNYEFENLDDVDFEQVISDFKNVCFKLSDRPWKNVIWDPFTKTIKTTGNKKLIKLLFQYYANMDGVYILSENDLIYIKNNYASFIAYDGELDDISLEMLLES